MKPQPRSAHLRAPWTRRLFVLALRLGAVVAAGCAQAVVHTRPWLSVYGFGLGMLLFVVAERVAPAPPDPEVETAATPVRGAPARGFWWLFVSGSLVCFVAGFAVHRGAPPPTTHGVWLLGMLLLIASPVRSWWRARSLARPRLGFAAGLVLLLAVSGGLFGWNLTSLPAEVHGDDAEVGNDAIQLLETEPFNLFTTGWYWLPRFHALPTAVGLKLLGVNLTGLRGTSVALGTMTVLVLFALASHLWGLEVALLSGLLLASARFFIHLSRAGYHYIDTALLSVLVVWLSARVWRNLPRGAAVWCGIALGLGVQTYYASRLVPPLLALTWFLWLLGSERPLIRARVSRFAAMVVAALATAAPMIGYFWNHRFELLWRTRETSVFTKASIDHLSYGYGTTNLGKILLIQGQAALTLFNAGRDSSIQYGYQGPLFEPVTAVLLPLGIAAALARPRQRRNQVLLLWIVIPVIVGAALTIDTPFFPRISGALPFAAIAVAVALWSLLDSIRAVVPERAGRGVAVVLAGGVLAAVFANNIRSYFFDYAPRYRHSPGVEIAAWIRAHGAGKTTYMVGGAPAYYIKHGTIRFLTHGYGTSDITDLKGYLQRQRLDPTTSLFIIMPQGHDLVSQLTAAVGPLDIQEHYNIGGQIDFYTAIPLAADTGGESGGA